MSDGREHGRYHHGALREALLEAGERVLRERGIASLSLRDLARATGVSHAAPRRHFPERQDLLDALAERGYDRLGDRLDVAVEDAADCVAMRVERAASAFARFAIENPALLELMNATKHRSGAAGVARSAESAFTPIVDLIREGQDQGILGEGTPEDVGLILYATVDGLATLVNLGAIPADRIDVLVGAAVEQFLKGNAPDA